MITYERVEQKACGTPCGAVELYAVYIDGVLACYVQDPATFL